MLTDDKNLIELYQDYIDDEGYVQRYNYDKGRYYNTGICLKGTKGNPGNPGRPGKDGLTPRINQDNGHWMIGDVDTGVSAIPEGETGGDGAFDVSVKYPTSGVEGGNTYTLEGALAVLNANLSASKKKGGMSIKFVQTSDNKYVQVRLMAQNFTTDVTQWQGVDEEPTAGSKNLVESGGIEARFVEDENKIGYKVDKTYTPNGVRLSVVFDRPIVGGGHYKVTFVSSTENAVSSIRVYRREGDTVVGDYTTLNIGSTADFGQIESNVDNFLFYTSNTVSAGIDIVIRVEFMGEKIDGGKIDNDSIDITALKSSQIDATPADGSNNLVKSGGVYNDVFQINGKIGDEEKTIVYPANSGLAFDGDSNKVVPATSAFNGVLIRLTAGAEYNITSSDFISAKLFDSKPSSGSVSTADFVNGYVPSTNSQYLLVTVRLSDTSNVSIKTSKFGIVGDIDDLKDGVEDLDEEVNGTTTSSEVLCELTANKYFNTKSHFTNGDTTYTRSSPQELEGCYCLKLAVSAGEKYKIFCATTGTKTIGLYILTSSDTTVITSAYTSNSEVELNITQSGYLYVNLNSYNYTTDYVKKIVTEIEGGLKQRVETLEENQVEVVDNLITDNSTKALSAKQGKILDEKIDGVEVEEKTAQTPNSTSGYYNSKDIGVSDTYNRTDFASLEGCACWRIPVSVGEKYEVYAKGASSTVALYVLTGANNIVLAKVGASDSKENGVVLNIEEGGYLYVNDTEYSTDPGRVIKVTTEIEGGYKKYVNEKIAENSPLYGKTIVCFGDSLTEFKDSSQKAYSDYLAEYYGATTINCGIGGTRLMQRTTPVLNPTSADEGYAGLDIISMVKAACGVEYDAEHNYDDVVVNAANYIKTYESDDNTAIVQRLLGIDWTTVDAVVVFAGTNDWNNGVGSWGSSGSSDAGTTMGAINEIIRLILTTYKHVKLYWITPIIRWINYSGGTGNPDAFSDNLVKHRDGDSGTLKQFSKMIEDKVILNHIPVCDAYNTLGWNMYNFSQYFPDSDGTHPTKGFREIAMKIASFIIANDTLTLLCL